MQTIEEVTAIAVTVITAVGTVLAALAKIKRDAPEIVLEEETKGDIAQELTDIKVALAVLRSEIDGKLGVKISYMETDIKTLFDKTDKLTDILIDQFSK